MVPMVNIFKSVAMAHAASREAYKLWMEIGYGFREVSSQSVLSSLESVLREEAYQVYQGFRLACGDDAQFSSFRVGVGHEFSLIFLPSVVQSF